MTSPARAPEPPFAPLPAIGAGVLLLLLGVGVAGLTVAAIATSVVGAGVVGAIGARMVSDPIDDQDRDGEPIGGIPFHHLWMTRLAKKGDYFRHHGRR